MSNKLEDQYEKQVRIYLKDVKELVNQVIFKLYI